MQNGLAFWQNKEPEFRLPGAKITVLEVYHGTRSTPRVTDTTELPRHASGAHAARLFGLGSESRRPPPRAAPPRTMFFSMASNAKDGDAAKLSEVQFTVTPSAVELSASEEERLRTLGLERRSGVPGLYLLRDANGKIELPS